MRDASGRGECCWRRSLELGERVLETCAIRNPSLSECAGMSMRCDGCNGAAMQHSIKVCNSWQNENDNSDCNSSPLPSSHALPSGPWVFAHSVIKSSDCRRFGLATAPVCLRRVRRPGFNPSSPILSSHLVTTIYRQKYRRHGNRRRLRVERREYTQRCRARGSF